MSNTRTTTRRFCTSVAAFVLVSGLHCASALGGAPPNDDCSFVTIALDGTTPFSTIDATTDGLPHAVCGADPQVYNDVWFRYEATQDGNVTVTLCDSADYDTKLVIYEKTPCLPGDANVLVCNDDNPCCSGGTSCATVPVMTGDFIRIRIGGAFDGFTGSGTFDITYDPQPEPPVNDDCANAIPIGDGVTPFDTDCASTDGADLGAFCELGFTDDQVHNDIWYTYEATCTGDLTVSMCNLADYDTRLAVYDGAICPDDPSTVLDCNDDTAGCGLDSEVTVSVVMGNTYLIRVGGFSDGDTGAGDIEITCIPVIICMPEALNDDCADAAPIGDGVTPFDTTCANTDGPVLTPDCDPGPAGDDQVHNDIWFLYEATCFGDLIVSTCGTADYDTRLAVYDSTACPVDPSTVLGCNDDSAGCSGFTSEVTVPVQAGETYLIRVGGFSDGDVGSGTISVECVPPPIPPINNTCENAIDILVSCLLIDIDTTNATTNGSPLDPFCDFPFGDNQLYNDVWYRWTASCDSPLTVSLCNSVDFDSRLAIYEDNGCPALAADVVDCNDDAAGCGLSSELTINTLAGTSYLIRIGGFSASDFGTGTLSLEAITGGPPTLTLLREQGPEVPAGQQVSLDLKMSGLCDHVAAGFQAFLEFDPLELQLEPGLSFYTPEPFGLPVLPIIATGGGGNFIDLASGINQPGGQLLETQNDAILATLVFTTLVDTCFPEVVFRPNNPPTRITDIGGVSQLPLELVGSAGTCPSDTNGNNAVDIDDVITVVLLFGTDDCAADVNNSGLVDIDDVVQVILDFGACP